MANALCEVVMVGTEATPILKSNPYRKGFVIHTSGMEVCIRYGTNCTLDDHSFKLTRKATLEDTIYTGDVTGCTEIGNTVLRITEIV